MGQLPSSVCETSPRRRCDICVVICVNLFYIFVMFDRHERRQGERRPPSDFKRVSESVCEGV